MSHRVDTETEIAFIIATPAAITHQEQARIVTHVTGEENIKNMIISASGSLPSKDAPGTKAVG